MSIQWIPTYKEFQNLFSNVYMMKILVSLSQLKDKRGCAADIAAILDIHISTTKKYLEMLYRYEFLNKEFVNSQPGKPTYYTLKKNKVTLILDLDTMALDFQSEFSIQDFLIREKKGNYPQVSFVLDRNGMVRSIKIRKRTKARRFVTRKFELTTSETHFIKYLPHPAMDPLSFLKICEKAQINDLFIIKSLQNFSLKLIELGIIEKLSKNEKKRKPTQIFLGDN